jgi:flagellar FliL protein
MSTATAVRGGPATAAGAAGADEAAPAKSKKKLFLLVGVVLVLAGAAAWFFLLRPSGGEAKEPERVPGEVVALEPISINLADGHYLRVGIALQGVEGAAHAPEGSQALNLVIDTFTGRSITELSDTATRQALQDELTHHVEEAYHHDVMDVYFTEFVTQ